jgi:GNAT superfamily N-acetyltransferase
MTPDKNLSVRQLRRKDHTAWLPLWQANNDNQLPRQQADGTWKKITTKSDPLFGLGLWLDGALIGILQYSLHAVTARTTDVCFMQDIFIAPEQRRQGFAKIFLGELFVLAKAKDWAWVYWFALESDQAAQTLYKKIGVKMEMSVHMLIPSISMI